MNRACIIVPRSIILLTPMSITIHIMIVLTFLQQSLALKSKNQITSPELAAL
jgi:hypothetical protein